MCLSAQIMQTNSEHVALKILLCQSVLVLCSVLELTHWMCSFKTHN